MDYQQLYARYQDALKLRELMADERFTSLKDTFKDRVLSSITVSADPKIVPYLAGMREVFEFVEGESSRVDEYREALDAFFKEKDKP